ncbi:hypothetical protein [Simplicispira metamorpha]|uniref:Restriction endonuclease n=1 Tax=Simplicispira metamorpha TaxID=80881 RepID=A0A4V6NQA4_9BURK|nr:hypothetical protein [Simplicispira metamorpha]TCP15966.1 hypothetical protein EV674_12237 [Simplicispira metamorpha]
MSADKIIYCLERLSDYRDFERLCSALLAGTDYPGIEPLGGTGDGGRDAIIRTDESGRRIVFAYTVRADWRNKLKGDCARVREKKHDPEVFVFVCTSALNASEKDVAHALVETEFGWKLDLYDIERLRVQLVGPQRHLVAQHPGIFTPMFFPQAGGQSLSESKDTILIDHVDADHALATWLSRRLTIAGYRTWCRGTAPLAGENPDDSVRKLMEVRAVLFLPLLSLASLDDQLFLERCAMASSKDNFVLPCSCVEGTDPRLPSRLKPLSPARFSGSWKAGLEEVLGRLSSIGTVPKLEAEQGRQIALRDYLPTRVTVARPEPVIANVFPLHLPATMLLYDLTRSLSADEVGTLRQRWAFIELNAYRLVAFTPPPDGSIPLAKTLRTPEFLWADIPLRDGKKTENLAKELARRSLEVVALQKGLQYCTDREVFYFPERDGRDWNQAFAHIDGRQTHVQLTGMRTKGWGDRASKFRYQLSPRFQPQRDVDGTWNVVLTIYVRCTDEEGKVYEGKEIGRRRKVVTKTWWNKDWIARLLGVVQALQTEPGRIEVGDGNRALVMETKPLSWECPVGLDVQALAGMADFGEELAGFRTREDGDDEAVVPTVEEAPAQ